MNKAAIQQSLFFHFFLIILFVVLTTMDKRKETKTFEFKIIEKEVVNIKRKPKVILNPVQAAQNKKLAPKKARQVFGVKRKALVDEEKGTVVVKKGNTITKKEDDKILKDDDPDDLPAPAEEFLITSMPRPLEEIRPEYPKWAKDEGITGSVIFEILIDGNGKVRQLTLLKSLHPELDKLAEEAMRKFKFRPAFIEKEPVAVRIRYAIRFMLEN